ncbi:MAG: tetratricopeptide repeat protein [Bryobacteraceae bacterium]
MPRSLAALLLVAAHLPADTGNAACAPCHRALHDSYLRTPMASTSGRAGSGGERFDRAAFGDYRVFRDGGRIAFEASGARKALDFFIGSGAVARSYAFFDGGFLFQAPVAYYSAGARWNLAPGFARYNYPYLTRPVLPGCLDCHSSRIQPVEGTQHAFRDPPFLESGVSCERCHGPGERHVSTARASDIVNPVRLDPERRDSVCAQCHLTGEFRIPRASSAGFRAGGRLSDSLAIFVWADRRPGLTVTSHGEKLAQSACRQASGDRLWCGSCHSVHASTRPAREKCLACHEPVACTESPAARRGRNCVDCHMPRGEVVDAEHVVYTDHSIPRRPRAARATADRTLAPFGGGAAAPRDLGLAYAQLALRESDAAVRERAFTLLRDAPPDTQVLLYLAELHKAASDSARAAALYQQVLRADPAQVTASVALGALLMERGETAEAIRLWKDALARSPGLQLVRMNLALAQLGQGDAASAEANLRKAVELNPALEVARKLLDGLRR